MHRGFQVGLLTATLSDYDTVGRIVRDDHQHEVDQALDRFVAPDGVINAKALGENWFPLVEADIFISHSHHDQDSALRLAGWLQSELGLKAFVDSVVWRSADRLLKAIDNAHCLNEDKKFYDYKRRNLSTSHVHMMLVMAIAKMMDQAEAVFFINSPNAMSAEGTTKNGQTSSPWIFAELGLTHLLRQTRPKRSRLALESREVKAMDSATVPVMHELDLSQLSPIDASTLTQWRRVRDQYDHALDALYALVPPLKRR